MYGSCVCKSARLSFRAFNLTMIFSFVELNNVHFSMRKKSNKVDMSTCFSNEMVKRKEEKLAHYRFIRSENAYDLTTSVQMYIPARKFSVDKFQFLILN